MQDSALSHLTILDATDLIAGPHCTRLMAGFGATVIKIEPPITGERMRGVGPFFEGRPHIEGSIPFLWLNTGKRSVTLDLETGTGREIFTALARKADVVVESFKPGTMERLGLGYDDLRRIKPEIVMTSISHFGQNGPHRDFEAEEIVSYATSGLMHQTGDPARAPLCAGPEVAQHTAGMNAYIATLMALFHKERTGVGQHVDLSIQESAMDNVEVALIENLRAGKTAKRTADEHALVPWQLYPCKDGYAAVLGGPIRHWVRGADLFEEPRLLEPRLAYVGDRMRNREEVKTLMLPWLGRHGKKEIFHAGQSRRLGFGYLADFHDVMDSPQHRARRFFEEIDHPHAGRHKLAGAPFRPEATPWKQARAPLLGEHNAEIYAGLLGLSAERIESLAGERVI